MGKASEIWIEILRTIWLIHRDEVVNDWQRQWLKVHDNEMGFFSWAFYHLPDSAGVTLEVLPNEVVPLLAEHCGGNVEDWKALREQWGECERLGNLSMHKALSIYADYHSELKQWEYTVMGGVMGEEVARHMQRKISLALFDLGKQRQQSVETSQTDILLVKHYSNHRPAREVETENGAFLLDEDWEVSEEVQVGVLALVKYGNELQARIKHVWARARERTDNAAIQFQALFMMLQTALPAAGAVASNGTTPKEQKAKEKGGILRELYQRLDAAGWLQEEGKEPKQTEEEFANVILNNSGELWFCGGNSELACLIDSLTANGFLPEFSEVEIAFFIANKKGAKVQPFTVEMYNTGRKSPRRPTEKNVANRQTKMPKILRAIGKLLDEPERIRKRKKELAEYNAAQRKEPFDWSGRRSSHSV